MKPGHLVRIKRPRPHLLVLSSLHSDPQSFLSGEPTVGYLPVSLLRQLDLIEGDKSYKNFVDLVQPDVLADTDSTSGTEREFALVHGDETSLEGFLGLPVLLVSQPSLRSEMLRVFAKDLGVPVRDVRVHANDGAALEKVTVRKGESARRDTTFHGHRDAGKETKGLSNDRIDVWNCSGIFVRGRDRSAIVEVLCEDVVVQPLPDSGILQRIVNRVPHSNGRSLVPVVSIVQTWGLEKVFVIGNVRHFQQSYSP